jgi:flagellar biosynthesis/type III secretory pathway protein FliH
MSTEQIDDGVSVPVSRRPIKRSAFEQATFEVVSITEPRDQFEPLSVSLVPDERPAPDPLFDLFDGQEPVASNKSVFEIYGEEQALSGRGSPAGTEVPVVDVPVVSDLPVVELLSEEPKSHDAATDPIESEVESLEEVMMDAAFDRQVVLSVAEELSQSQVAAPEIEPEIEPEESVLEPQDPPLSAEEVYSASDLRTAIERTRAESNAETEARVRAIEVRYAEIFEDMRSQMRESVEAVEQRTVTLALQLAGKILNAAIEVNPEYILTIVKEAVKVSGGATIKAIRVSPGDYEFLSKIPASIIAKELDSQWKIEPDEGIRVGCVVETVAGTVDYDLDKACARMRESVSKIR